MDNVEMNNKEILDSAPDWADTHRKLLDYPDCTTYADNAIDGRLDRSLVDIKRISALEQERLVLLSCLLGISDECIGQITMSHGLDAEGIGQSIYAATGMTNPQMNAYLKEIVSLKP
jgi:hypothetical protein